jgi:ribosomal protein S18 acetylase RimI-like enzyme
VTEAGGVRRGVRDDLDRVTALWIALTEHHARIEPLFALSGDVAAHARGLLLAQLRDPDAQVFVHGEGDALDGLCSVRIDRAPPVHVEVLRAEITDLFVDPAQRRRGIAEALLSAALAWARTRGIDRVEARVSARNQEGQAFWRAAGFGDFMDVLHRRL